MRVTTSCLVFFKGALTYTLTLTPERTLEEDCTLKVMNHFLTEVLFLTDGFEFGFIVLLTVSVTSAKTL